MGRRKNLPLLEEVTIENIGAEGKSIARVDNIVVFVKDAIPGDLVDLQVFRKKGRYMEARVVKYHRYSDQRVEPFCKHFGICGGCKWQHLPYDRQLFYKEQQVVDAFRHIAGVEIPETMPILASDPITKYRNKLEYTFSNHRWLLEHEDFGLAAIPQDVVGTVGGDQALRIAVAQGPVRVGRRITVIRTEVRGDDDRLLAEVTTTHVPT